MNSTFKKLLISGALMAAIAPMGCKSSDKSASAHGGQMSAGGHKETAADVKFETSQDPPFRAQTRFAAGQLAETQGETNRAIEQYWAAIKLDPKCKEAYYRLGVVYCELKHYPDAVVAWKQYLKITGGDPMGYSNLGFCYELSGQHREAEENFRKGIEKDPKNNACRVNYGLMLIRDSRVNEGIIQLQAVLSEAEVHYNLASVFEHTGQKEQARAEYRRAIDLDPNMVDAEVRLSAMR